MSKTVPLEDLYRRGPKVVRELLDIIEECRPIAVHHEAPVHRAKDWYKAIERRWAAHQSPKRPSDRDRRTT